MTLPKDESRGTADPSMGTLYKGGKRTTPTTPRTLPKSTVKQILHPKPYNPKKDPYKVIAKPHDPRKPVKDTPLPNPLPKGPNLNFKDMLKMVQSRSKGQATPDRSDALKRALGRLSQGTKKSGEGK